MIIKTSLSNLFRGLEITDQLKESILGKSVTSEGREIGTIIGVSPLTDCITIDVDDSYADELRISRK